MTTVVDIFCGCGGFSLGARQAGFKSKLAIDIDPILSFPYIANLPQSRLLIADVSKLEASHIRSYVGQVDGVYGGPPCQGFSNIGLRRKNDPRRDLLIDFFRIVAQLRPKFFVMENVPGLVQADAKPLLDRAMELVSKRYNLCGPLVLDAADYGAATHRPRVFVIGMDTTQADPITLDDIQRRQRPPATVQAAISDLQNAKFVRTEDSYDVWRIVGRGRPSLYSKPLRSKSGEFTGHTITTHSRDVKRRFSKVPQGGVDDVGWHPRLSWEGQCTTLRAGTGSDRGSFQSVRPIHPDEPRVITVREAARLQGFPDDFKFHPTTWHSFRMIGNSVSPIMSRTIFSTIAKKIDGGNRLLAAAE